MRPEEDLERRKKEDRKAEGSEDVVKDTGEVESTC